MNSNVVVTTNVPVVVVNMYPRLNVPGLKAVSGINLAIWIINIILSAVAIALMTSFYGGFFVFDLFGIVGTLDYLIAGILGVVGADKKTSGLLIASLVFSVFSIFTGIGGSLLAIMFYYVISSWNAIRYCSLAVNLIAIIINISQISIISVALCNKANPQRTVGFMAQSQMAQPQMAQPQMIQQPQYGVQQYSQPIYAAPHQYPVQGQQMSASHNTSYFPPANVQPTSFPNFQSNYSTSQPNPQPNKEQYSGLPRAKF